MPDIHPVNLLDLINAINIENPDPIYGVSIWPLEPNTLGVFKRNSAYTSEWEDLFQSDNAHTLYKAVRSSLRRRIRESKNH